MIRLAFISKPIWVVWFYTLPVRLTGKLIPDQTNPNRFELFLKAAYAQAGEFCISRTRVHEAY